MHAYVHIYMHTTYIMNTYIPNYMCEVRLYNGGRHVHWYESAEKRFRFQRSCSTNWPDWIRLQLPSHAVVGMICTCC